MKIKITLESNILKDDEEDLKLQIRYAVERYGELKHMLVDTWDY